MSEIRYTLGADYDPANSEVADYDRSLFSIDDTLLVYFNVNDVLVVQDLQRQSQLGVFQHDPFDFIHPGDGGLSIDFSDSTGRLQLVGGDFGDVLIGGSGKNDLRGGQGDDRLVGGDRADILDGSEGANTLSGGDGNDTYYVHSAGDVVQEGGGHGIDTVYASSDWTLGAGQSVEFIRAADRTGRQLTGNELANRIYGADGKDRLDGGGGKDILFGGGGADTFVFDEASDPRPVKPDLILDFSGAQHDSLAFTAFGTGTVVRFHENATNTAGTLLVRNGSRELRVHLDGQFIASDFHRRFDGVGGSLIVNYRPPAESASDLAASSS